MNSKGYPDRSSSFLENFEPHFIPCCNDDQSERTANENEIQRHILDCLGALIELKRGKSTLHSLESKIFFLAVSSMAAFATKRVNNGSNGAQMQADDLLMRNFPPKDYIPASLKLKKKQRLNSPIPQRNASHWLCMHWTGIVGHHLSSEDLRALIGADPMSVLSIDEQAYKASPAHYAAANGAGRQNLPFLSVMAEACPRIAHVKDDKGWLPLHYAAAYSDSVEMLELLLQLNPLASSTATTSGNQSLPIHLLAARTGMLEGQKIAMMKCLFEADPASATEHDEHGDTVLHIVCFFDRPNREAVVRFCLSMFPQLAAMTSSKHGVLPLHKICHRAADDKQPLGVLSLLLETYREGTNKPDIAGYLPLHCAASLLNLAAVKAVSEANPSVLSVNCTNYWGSPLCVAARRTDAEGLAVVQYLYEQRPESIRDVTDDGLLPLYFASRYGSLEIVRFLAGKYPEAAMVGSIPEKELPLHQYFLRGFSRWEKTWCNEIDILRVLLRCYAKGAGVANSEGITPYHMATRVDRYNFEGRLVPPLAKRLLLRADPTINPAELRRLNYMDRRMAMFLVFMAVPKNINDSFVVRLRRLNNKDKSLLRLIVAFL